eukprot:5741736-Pyramimonas_sp.AAC.1
MSSATANNCGDSGHPCRMPESILKPLNLAPPTEMMHVVSWYKARMKCNGQVGRSSDSNNLCMNSLLTLGNAAAKSKSTAEARSSESAAACMPSS